MISVSEAGQIIAAQTRHYNTESIPFESAVGRVLAEDIVADRDLPACNRATMDGIAIRFSAFAEGVRVFSIKGVQAAGDRPIEIEADQECIEIMTGGTLPVSVNTVIRYEDVVITDGMARVMIDDIRKGQSVHLKAKDKKLGEVLASSNRLIDSSVVGIAASAGKSNLVVRKLPRTIIISTGDELVEVGDNPLPYQVRRSNNHTIKAALDQYHLHADLLHLPDNPGITKNELTKCLADYDVLILSGGVSMGKFDYLPQVLEEVGVTKLFHKVRQRPGKPFWFGRNEAGVLVFAFPGNPVSTFMCLHRYFMPWLEASLYGALGSKEIAPKCFAVLDGDFQFVPPLACFLQVNLSFNDQSQLVATPLSGNGSGDFANLVETNAFMELPEEKTTFKKGEMYPVWPFKHYL